MKRSTRREFLKRVPPAAGAALGLAAAPYRTLAGPRTPLHQKRWRAAFGLNGFMSSASKHKKSYPIWEVLDFAQRQGFEGIELVEGWPEGPYPSPDDDRAIAALKGLYDRYGMKIFSLQTSSGEAFDPDPAARRHWIERFTGWCRLARKLGCECIGTWPGGGLRGQSLEQARERLIDSLRAAAPAAAENGLLISLEIEPPFVFHTLEDMIALVDGVGHPAFRTMYDPSHFDLMNGGRGKPEELLEKVGVHRIGYIHLTDTDGTLRDGGTSKHLPCGDGHVDIRKSLEMLWRGGYAGWIMIDAWEIPDAYDACLKGKAAIDAAQAEFSGAVPKRQ